jgi:hypothetical protein
MAVGLIALWAIQRRRRGRRRALAPSQGNVVRHDDSPSGKLLALAEEVRGTLISRFGPAMRARTTEEIAADPQVKESLGADRLGPLIRLLAEADRWKFATLPGNGHEELLLQDLPGWESWHRTLVLETSIKPGSQYPRMGTTRESPAPRDSRRPSPSRLDETPKTDSPKGQVK